MGYEFSRSFFVGVVESGTVEFLIAGRGRGFEFSRRGFGGSFWRRELRFPWEDQADIAWHHKFSQLLLSLGFLFIVF